MFLCFKDIGHIHVYCMDRIPVPSRLLSDAVSLSPIYNVKRAYYWGQNPRAHSQNIMHIMHICAAYLAVTKSQI